MFLSWLAQNVYQSELGSTKSQIERDVGFVNSEMTKAIQWMVTFQTERKRDKPDTEMILNSAIGYAETVGTIIEAANRVDPNSPVLTEHWKEFQKLFEPVRAAATNRNLQEIMETSSALMLWFRTIGSKAHEAIDEKVAEVNSRENKWKWIFRGFFLIGSLIYAATWWSTYFSPSKKA